jgi:hypothetical protein
VESEESHIIGRAFHTGHDARFVLELDAGRRHLVADACNVDTGGKIIAELALVGGGQFTAEEGGDIVCFNGMDCGTDVTVRRTHLFKTT